MSEPATTLLSGWHDVFVILATGSATFIGAMFIVVSIGGRFLTPEKLTESGLFLTPSLVHLTVVLLGCALGAAPLAGATVVAACFGVIGVGGLGYALCVAFQTRTRKLEWIDHICYGFAPIGGYALIAAASGLAAARASISATVLTAGFAALLGVSIRNVWDLMVFFVARAEQPPPGESPPDQG